MSGAAEMKAELDEKRDARKARQTREDLARFYAPRGKGLEDLPPDDPRHGEAAEEECLTTLMAISALYPALDRLCFIALSNAPYKSPMWERISQIHGHFEAACDLARREGR